MSMKTKLPKNLVTQPLLVPLFLPVYIKCGIFEYMKKGLSMALQNLKSGVYQCLTPYLPPFLPLPPLPNVWYLC